MNCQSHLYRGKSRSEISRRWFFQQCGVGLGAIALGQLFTRNGWAAAGNNPLAPKAPHFKPRAKRVIYLFQAGGPSHLELFDNKPELSKWDGKVPPSELLKDYRAAFISPSASLLGPKFNLRNTANPARNFPNCCHTWPKWLTILPSSNRCTPTPSIMRPRRFS